MRRVLLASLIALSACSKAPRNEERDVRQFDVREEPSSPMSSPQARVAPPGVVAGDAAGGGIAPTAAPGVAFNYRYAFRLPNAKIAAVQEEHAQMCEKLGIDRCRITGMRYRLENETDISAMLEFKLDPAIARQFGKDANAGVTRASGMLVDSEITGVDAGATIEASTRDSATLQAQLKTIEARLAGLRANDPNRSDLEQQAAELRTRIRGASQTRSEALASLATTPMVMTYGSGSVIPGFSDTSPLREAMGSSWGAFTTMLGLFIVAFGALLPWAILGGIAWVIWRRFARGKARRYPPVASEG